MKNLKRLLFGVCVLILIVIGVGLLLPSSLEVRRSVTIAAPAAVIFDQVNTLASWRDWSPLHDADSTMVVTPSDIASGAGASFTWMGESVGGGTLTIVESRRDEWIRARFEFAADRVAFISWTFDELAEGTLVTWTLEGNAGRNLLGRYLGLVLDRLIGPDFERGLASLKAICEG